MRSLDGKRVSLISSTLSPTIRKKVACKSFATFGKPGWSFQIFIVWTICLLVPKVTAA